jgi:hypothetical protein
LPSVGTREARSPLPIRLAVSRKRLIRPCNAREARTENENARSRKASMNTAATIRLVVTEVAVAARFDRNVTAIRPPHPLNDRVTAWYSTRPSVTVPRRGTVTFPAPGTVE